MHRATLTTGSLSEPAQRLLEQVFTLPLPDRQALIAYLAQEEERLRSWRAFLKQAGEEAPGLPEDYTFNRDEANERA